MSIVSKQQEKINNIRIDYDCTLLDALKLMDETGKKLLIVFRKDKYFSLLSVGDIQRALIKQKSLETPLHLVLREDIEVAHENQNRESIIERMKNARTECMPVLNDVGELIDAIFWEDIVQRGEMRVHRELNIPVVIMAGGKGTRLQPITNVLPKPLIPLGEKAIVEQIMDRFIEFGCNKIFMTLNYKAEFMRQYFKLSGKEKYNITFVEEGEFLGTAGSIGLLKDKIKSTFFVSNCDILIDQNYAEIYDYHKENKNEMTIVAALKHFSIPYGIMETGENGLLNSIQEKPEFTYKINSGVYILEPELLEDIPEGEFFHITHLMDKILKRNGRIGAFPVTEKSWKDIGNWEEYLKEIDSENK